MLVIFLPVLVLWFGCNRSGRLVGKEYAYISAPQVNLRDRLSAVYNKVGVVSNGQRVEILEKSKRFYRVRAEGIGEGWVEQRYLADQEVFDGFAKLARDHASQAGQSHGVARAELNMHLTPARDGEHLFQLKEGEKVQVLQRAVTDKNEKALQAYEEQRQRIQKQIDAKPEVKTTAAPVPAKVPDQPTPPVAASAAKAVAVPEIPDAPPSIPEDWLLVRDGQQRVGWVLSRMIDIDVPFEIAQYAEGKRIVGSFVLNTVTDTAEDGTTRQVPQYLVLTTEPKDGQPFDYNHIRVFSWNGRRHRYETAYRERNLFGVLPVDSGREVFDKEGDLPTFVLRVKDDNGQTIERKYKLNGPIVRRVLSPTEYAAQKQALAEKLSERKAARAGMARSRAARPASTKSRRSKHR